MLISLIILLFKVHSKNIIYIHQWAKQSKKKFWGFPASIPCSKYKGNPRFSKTQIIDPLGFVWMEHRETGDE